MMNGMTGSSKGAMEGWPNPGLGIHDQLAVKKQKLDQINQTLSDMRAVPENDPARMALLTELQAHPSQVRRLEKEISDLETLLKKSI